MVSCDSVFCYSIIFGAVHVKIFYFPFKGAIHIYLTKLPVLGSANGTRISYLTSLREVILWKKEKNRPFECSVPLPLSSNLKKHPSFHVQINFDIPMLTSRWTLSFAGEKQDVCNKTTSPPPSTLFKCLGSSEHTTVKMPIVKCKC